MLRPSDPIIVRRQRIRTLADGSLLLLDRVPAPSIRQAVLEVGSPTNVEHLFRALIGAYLTGASEFVLRVPGGLTPEIRKDFPQWEITAAIPDAG